MNGIPMVATSPVRQDSPLGVSSLDITGYHPPWKQLTEFALRPDSDHASSQFSSLVHQMHGYDAHYGGVGGPEVYQAPPAPPGHPDLPLMPPMLPYSSPEVPGGAGPTLPFHLADGNPGEDFGSFGEPDHHADHHHHNHHHQSQIETKV